MPWSSTWRPELAAELLQVALVGLAIPDPNSALGSEGLLQDAMTSAGLTGVTVDQSVWHATWPDPETAWRSAVQGRLGGALSGLNSPALAHIRGTFVSQLRGLSTRQVDDVQQVLIGIGTAA